MEVCCPACMRQLSVPQAAPGTALQCPYCGSMFQLAAPPAPLPAATAAYGAAPGIPAGHTPAPGVGIPAETGFAENVITTRRAPRRPSKDNTPVLVAAAVLLVAAVGGLIGLGVWMSQRDADRTVAASPTEIASQKAHELILKEMKLPPGVQFAEQEERMQKLPNNRYRMAGHMDVPSRVGGVYLRQKWTAQLSQMDNGSWKLDRLVVDGETISGSEEIALDAPSRFNTSSRWLTGNDSSSGGGGNYSAGPDRSTRWATERVAEAIKESAALRKTLVVWLIDRSMSARPQQQDFLRSAESALRELRGGKPGEEPQLSMAVVSFGSDVQFPLEKPSSESAAVRQALESIAEDTSGREQTFTAISQAAEKYGSFVTENSGYLVFVVLSDEMGDDDGQLDQTAALLKQKQIVVHTIGVSAPFGLAVAEAQRGLEGGGDTGPSQVRQGPESRHAEMISLASIGGVAVELDSGFGPFSLARLCHESGGQYLACQDFGVAAGSRYLSVSWGGAVSSKPAFDPAVIRKYAPDYVSEQEYQQILASNKACQALHEAAKLPFAQALVSANTTFPKRDEASFKRSLDTAQRDSAKFEPRLTALYDALKKGESDRPKLTRPRWQAAYDLAMGRTLAARVKTEGYNAMLAKIKSGGNFTKPGANTWVLQESDTIGAGSTFEKMLKQSHEYLARVVKDHPGTPWAYLAERELQIKAGWQWTEQ